jgi:hypothetical protein
MQAERAAQATQPTPWAPPGFCQAAGAVDCSVRFVQPHCPADENGWFAWTEIQYWPSRRPIEGSIVMTKLASPAKLWFGRDATSVPGRSPEVA